MEKRPLVSVGIPCYNRPDGLKRTLDCILGQTYKNLEIIISDNCSQNPEMKIIGETYCSRDERIRYIRQPENKGALNNFKFVLKEAKGEYFMWAADDDEWLPEFIEANVNNIKDAGSCFTGYIIRNRFSGTNTTYKMPKFTGDKYKNAAEFLKNLTPSMIYGLHKRETILWTADSDTFDFWDCYFCLKQIIENNYCIVEKNLYIAGVDEPEYVLKPAGQDKKSVLNYRSFYSAVDDLIKQSKFSRIKRINLKYLLIMTSMRSFSEYENVTQPVKALVTRMIFLGMYIPVFIKKNIRI